MEGRMELGGQWGTMGDNGGRLGPIGTDETDRADVGCLLQKSRSPTQKGKGDYLK